MAVLEKYRKSFSIDSEDLTALEMKVCSDEIGTFMNFLRKVIPVMQEHKRAFKRVMTTRDNHDRGPREILDLFTKYEDIATTYYCNDDYQ